MTTTPRLDPLADLGDFAPAAPRKPKPDAATVEKIATENGFPSRQATKPPVAPEKREPRRRKTGRNQQFNIKATAETIDKFYRMADELNVAALGELLELALTALEEKKKAK